MTVKIQKARLFLFLCATAGVAAAIIGLNGLTVTSSQSDVIRVPAQEIRKVNPEAIKMANEQLNWAHGQSFARLDQHFAPVEELFNTARVREFSDRCLSLESKWLLLKDQLTDSGEHSALIESAFRSCIFEEAALEQLLQQCTTAYVQEVGSIDGEMLVRLRVDLESLPSGAVPGFDANTLHQRFAEAIKRSVMASKSDVLAMVQRETVSFIVSEVVTAAMVQLGVSSGILATGAASGWATFGTGLVVGLLVDYAVQQYSDPAGTLTAELNQRLQELKSAILYGDQESPGLIPRLREFAQARAVARRDALQEVFNGVAGQ